MRDFFFIAGVLACFILQPGQCSYKALSYGSTMEHSKQTETTITQTTITETHTTTVAFREYFIKEFYSWRSAELSSVELKSKVETCFKQVINGRTFWDKIYKNEYYAEFLAAAVGYTGSVTDEVKYREFVLQMVSKNPRLVALGFKSISKNIQNPQEKLIVSQTAKQRYHIPEKVVIVKQDWKWKVITDFYDFNSAGGRSMDFKQTVLQMFEYDTTYFDKFIKKKIYAQYLAHATGFTGDIKQVDAFKGYLKKCGNERPRLLALAFKYLSKNLKNPKTPLCISKTAQTRFGIKELTVERSDWKSYTIKEFAKFDSNGKFKPRDQTLRVKSMLNYKLDQGTFFDLIIKRHEYLSYFTKAVGFEEAYDEKRFREYVFDVCESYPKLVSLAFRSIARNLENSSVKLQITSSMESIISEIRTKTTLRKTTTTTTTTTTVTTRTWEKYVVTEWMNFHSASANDEDVRTKLSNFWSYSAHGYSCIEKILKTESYAEYLAYSTGYQEDYRNTNQLISHLKNVGNNNPRVLASSLKHVTQNIENSETKLVVGKTATEKLGIQSKTFEAKIDWKKYVIKEFATMKSASSPDLKQKVKTLLEYDTTYWTKILENSAYVQYLSTSTGYEGYKGDIAALKKHFKKLAKSNPLLVALCFKNLAKHFENPSERLVISQTAKTRFGIKEMEFSQTQTEETSSWSYYAIKVFANLKSQEGKDHFIRAQLKKLIDQDFHGVTYLQKCLKRSHYMEYLAKATGYTGEISNTTMLETHIRQVIQEKPRQAGIAFKYIAKNQRDSNSNLIISDYLRKTYLKEQKNKKDGKKDCKAGKK